MRQQRADGRGSGFLWKAASSILTAVLFAALARAQHPDPPKPGPAPAPADTDEQRITDLVNANHILFDLGVMDGFGHVSVRSAKNPAHYFMSQSKAPGMVTKDDILELNENSEVANGPGRATLERYIHGEIYRLRPDVQAVVHSHSPAVIPFGATKVAMRPVLQTAGFLPPATPIFEIRDVVGDEGEMLIVSSRIGAAMARALGDAPVVLLRGHGSAVVGANLRDAVYRSYYTLVNAQIQMEALKLGEPVYLTPVEAAKVDVVNRAATGKSWELWLAHANANTACRK